MSILYVGTFLVCLLFIRLHFFVLSYWKLPTHADIIYNRERAIVFLFCLSFYQLWVRMACCFFTFYVFNKLDISDLTIPCSNATLLRDNMPGHSFNPSYSDEDLLNFVRNVRIYLFNKSSTDSNDHLFHYRARVYQLQRTN